MPELPPHVLEPLAGTEHGAVREWWSRLTQTARVGLVAAGDDAREERFFGRVADAQEQPPVVIGGRFVPHDDAWGCEEWKQEYYEYLVEHPEVVVMGSYL